MAYRVCERLGGFLGAHEKTAPFVWILKRGKKNNGRRRIADIEDSGSAWNAHDFDVFIFRHEAEANALSDGIAVREEGFCEIAVYDGGTRVVLVICFSENAAAKQRNSKRSEKGWRDLRCIGQETGASARIGGHRRNRVVPTLWARDCCVPKANRTNSRQAGDARQELLVVTVQVEVLVAAGLWI